MTRFIPDDLFHEYPENARAKRWLVTAWVLYGDRKITRQEVTEAREIWDVSLLEFKRGPVANITVLSVLLQLCGLGLLRDIEPAQGGYQVAGKAVAA